MSGPSAAEALRAGGARLVAAGLAAAEARPLLADAMGIEAGRLTLHLPDRLDDAATARFAAHIAARLARRPVSHILGRRAFWRHSFIVTPDVLDPRPETEILVAEALRLPFQRMLDLGTGSGCILLSCLADMPQATGQGADISPLALTVATQNGAHLGLGARASFIESDWFARVRGPYDLITANPPYIAADEMEALAPELRYEPQIALTPGGDGLDAYRALAAGAGAHLCPGGRLLLEIGPSQGAAVLALLAAQGFADLRILPDLDGRDRVVAAILPHPANLP